MGGSDGSEPSPSQLSTQQGSYGGGSTSDEGPEDTPDHNSMSEAAQRTESSLVDDAENPLQLLARASYFQPSPRDSRSKSTPQHVRRNGSVLESNADSSESIEAFFTGAKVDLDVGSDIDPIDIGLVSEEEAESLFA